MGEPQGDIQKSLMVRIQKKSGQKRSRWQGMEKMSKEKTAKNRKHVCKRCGQCCIDNGTIWVHSEHPLIKAIVKAIVDRPNVRILRQQSFRRIIITNGFFRDGGPCDMLVFERSGQAVCLLQKWLGHNAKPENCQEYPLFDFDDRDGDNRCHHEIAEDKAKSDGESANVK